MDSFGSMGLFVIETPPGKYFTATLRLNYMRTGMAASQPCVLLAYGRDHRIYIRLAALRAPVQPSRSPAASSRLARAMVAANCDLSCACSRFTEATVGCRSSCAAID